MATPKCKAFAQGGNNQINTAPINSHNYKYSKCRNWETTGSCKYGSDCVFAHGPTELISKSENNQKLLIDPMTMLNPILMFQDPNYLSYIWVEQLKTICGTEGLELQYIFEKNSNTEVPQSKPNRNQGIWNKLEKNPNEKEETQPNKLNNIYMGDPYNQ